MIVIYLVQYIIEANSYATIISTDDILMIRVKQINKQTVVQTTAYQ